MGVWKVWLCDQVGIKGIICEVVRDKSGRIHAHIMNDGIINNSSLSFA